MEDLKIKLFESGTVKEYNILFTFECEELGKSYIAFTDDDMEKNGERVIYIAYYNPDKDISELEPVTDEEELKMAEDVLHQVMNSQAN